MRIFQNVFLGHLVVEWALLAYANPAFPQYDKMEALIEYFQDKPIMQTGKIIRQSNTRLSRRLKFY